MGRVTPGDGEEADGRPPVDCSVGPLWALPPSWRRYKAQWRGTAILPKNSAFSTSSLTKPLRPMSENSRIALSPFSSTGPKGSSIHHSPLRAPLLRGIEGGSLSFDSGSYIGQTLASASGCMKVQMRMATSRHRQLRMPISVSSGQPPQDARQVRSSSVVG